MGNLAHGHHIVMKLGKEAPAEIQAPLKASRDILDKYHINWWDGKENLTWAPNIQKFRDLTYAKRVLERLKAADDGTKESIVDELERIAEDIKE